MTGLNKGQIAIRFQSALFIVVEKLAASGYGDYVPVTAGHIILSSVLVIIGRALECYIAGKASLPDQPAEILFERLTISRTVIPMLEFRFSDAHSDKSGKKGVQGEVPRDNKPTERLHEPEAAAKAHEDPSGCLLLLPFQKQLFSREVYSKEHIR